MKIFQIAYGLCYWDATIQHSTLESTRGFYPPNILFIEAPDYVWENWSFDDTKEGDERFIPPIPPEGFLYDRNTNTFYPESEPPPEPLVDGDTKILEEKINDIGMALSLLLEELS